MSVISAASRLILLPNKQHLNSRMKQNQIKSLTRQRVSQSQFQSINQQQSVSNNASRCHPSSMVERTHHMTQRSTSKKTPPLSSLLKKVRLL